MEEDLKKLLTSGFIGHNHFQVQEIQKGIKLIMKVDLKEESLNPYGFAHGGLMFGLGDTAMGLLVSSTGKNVVTQNGTINYLRPAGGKVLTAEAEIIKDGKRFCFLRCNFYNEEHVLTAVMEGNYVYVE